MADCRSEPTYERKVCILFCPPTAKYSQCLIHKQARLTVLQTTHLVLLSFSHGNYPNSAAGLAVRTDYPRRSPRCFYFTATTWIKSRWGVRWRQLQFSLSQASRRRTFPVQVFDRNCYSLRYFSTSDCRYLKISNGTLID